MTRFAAKYRFQNGPVIYEGDVIIPLTGSPGSGSGTIYPPMFDADPDVSQPCNPPKYNCNYGCVAFFELDIQAGWSILTEVEGNFYPINVTHVYAFWKAKYDGYTPVGDVDFSMNCHGYAFGAGDWPEDGMYGATTLLGVGTCYETTSPSTAVIAMTTGHSHSIKVTGGIIQHEEASQEIITKTSEKCRESQIFERTNPAGVSPIIAPSFSAVGVTLDNFYRKL